MPTVGINDVLIRVHKTGICGTDLHIESWDAWAARTRSSPPLSSATSSSARSSRSAATSPTSRPGDLVSGEGHVVCGRCRHCLAGRRHLCAHTIGLGVGRDGAFAEYVVLPGDQRLAPLAGHRPGGRRDLRPVRQRGPHRARLPDPRRGRARRRRRPDRADGHGRRPPRRRPPHRRQRAQRRSVASSPIRMGATIAVDPRERALADLFERARHGRGLRRRAGDVRQRASAARRDRRRWPTAAAWRSSGSRPRRSASTSTRSS